MISGASTDRRSAQSEPVAHYSDHPGSLRPGGLHSPSLVHQGTRANAQKVGTMMTYFVNVGRDLQHARKLLDRAGVAYVERPRQPGIRAIDVPTGTDVSAVFTSRSCS